MKKYSKGIYSLFLLVLIFSLFAIPVYSANPVSTATNAMKKIDAEVANPNFTPSAVGDFAKIWAGAIYKLTTGDLAGFVQLGIKGLPLIGIFMLLYIVGKYAAAITIFRKPEFEKYAKIFAWGIAMVGIASPGVFTMIYSLFGATLSTILFLALFIFIIWGFFHKLQTGKNESFVEKANSEKDALAAGKDLKDFKREIGGDTKKQERTAKKSEKYDVRNFKDAMKDERLIYQIMLHTKEFYDEVFKKWYEYSNYTKFTFSKKFKFSPDFKHLFTDYLKEIKKLFNKHEAEIHAEYKKLSKSRRFAGTLIKVNKIIKDTANRKNILSQLGAAGKNFLDKYQKTIDRLNKDLTIEADLANAITGDLKLLNAKTNDLKIAIGSIEGLYNNLFSIISADVLKEDLKSNLERISSVSKDLYTLDQGYAKYLELKVKMDKEIELVDQEIRKELEELNNKITDATKKINFNP